MIRLSKLTDYAVVVMTAMMQGDGGPHTAVSLAERTGLPAPTVSKILKLLARDGLMASHRGAAGGYRLARAPDAINVAQIIAAIDGPIALTDCVEGAPGACGVESLCPRRGNWDRVNRAVRGALEGVSLADMARPMFHDPVLPKTAPALPAAADAI
ncbi:SUF system Fe-S cluster assembly regulator [Nitrospirillum sp. BR 11828]|uniref:SUF system Fe-S cluster assembly regulator n=1 Tax=Nitrospirillum sp. BR 11828 TaxID=3104325 RepID=UPI002ACA4129|nr:SUF system Fe-S cluster assembly regulator [Nitrospirillum sp. BR 11828]MDZ5646185.1 SUF system Fe-S cluster assembly regulator [Nitrospirillum sp. BR 11828]